MLTLSASRIGVSNYSIKFLEELLPQASIVPAANQVENHPYLPQQELSDYCKSNGILIEAYSPLGSTGSPLFKEEGVQEVAKKHNVGAGNVLISYQGKLHLLGAISMPLLATAHMLTLSSQPRPRRPAQERHAISHRTERRNREA